MWSYWPQKSNMCFSHCHAGWECSLVSSQTNNQFVGPYHLTLSAYRDSARYVFPPSCRHLICRTLKSWREFGFIVWSLGYYVPLHPVILRTGTAIKFYLNKLYFLPCVGIRLNYFCVQSFQTYVYVFMNKLYLLLCVWIVDFMIFSTSVGHDFVQ